MGLRLKVLDNGAFEIGLEDAYGFFVTKEARGATVDEIVERTLVPAKYMLEEAAAARFCEAACADVMADEPDYEWTEPKHGPIYPA